MYAIEQCGNLCLYCSMMHLKLLEYNLAHSMCSIKIYLNVRTNITGKLDYYDSLYYLTLLVENSRRPLNELKQKHDIYHMDTHISNGTKGFYSENEALSINGQGFLSVSHFFLFRAFLSLSSLWFPQN